MLKRIKLLRDYGVFRHFDWPENLAAFKRFNVIYGWNASGKSTLARLLRCLEQRTVPEEGDITLEFDGEVVGTKDFSAPSGVPPIRVFNRDYVDHTILGPDGPKPIFILGEENIEKQKRLEEIKATSSELETHSRSATNAKEAAERAMDSFNFKQATAVREALRSPGRSDYANYNKTDFKKASESMLIVAAVDPPLEEYQVQELNESIHAQRGDELLIPSIDDSGWHQTVKRATTALSNTPDSAPLDELVKDSALNEWTRQGLHLHQERGANDCLFCQNKISQARLKDLAQHFHQNYERQRTEINSLLTQVEAELQKCQIELSGRPHPSCKSDFEMAVKSLSEVLENARRGWRAWADALNTKKGRMFEPVPAPAPVESIGKALSLVAKVGRRSNEANSDIENAKTEARKKLEQHMVRSRLEEYRRLKSEFEAAATRLDALSREQGTSKEEAKALERALLSTRPAADELNRKLAAYFGHNCITFHPEGTGFQILREGKVATNLSEGERTGISLLYFLISLRDKSVGKLSDCIVVIDDPVSSLDSNALYHANGFIIEHVKNAHQVFLFTHSFPYLRLLMRWAKYEKQSQVFMVRTQSLNGQRAATIAAMDPTLEKYETEYHYLFKLVHEAALKASIEDLQEVFSLPNSIRRLLESFLSFKVPEAASLDKRMLSDNVKADAAVKRAIAKFCHAGSHDNTFDESETDPGELERALDVAKKTMDLIEQTDRAHFNGMIAALPC